MRRWVNRDLRVFDKLIPRINRRSRRRVKAGLVGPAGSSGALQCIVDFKNDTLSAVVAVLLLVLAADDGEGVHYVGHGVARGWEALLEPYYVFRRLAFSPAPVAALLCRQVEAEEGGVQLAAK